MERPGRPQVLSDPRALSAWSAEQAAAGSKVALVPTMGFLHEGHLSLVREARRRAQRVVVSIFVNPTQFGPSEDFARYPRDLDRDLALLAPLAVDMVFTPQPADAYPDGFDTYVVPERLAGVLCGRTRPGHFRGVCTVVAVLFGMSRCHIALFGEKDFQQLQIIRRMTRDLWLGVEIVGMPIVREPDGLARSSRNAYLSEQERHQALVLSRALDTVAALFARGERRAPALIAEAKGVVARARTARVDYIEIVDAESLTPVEHIDREVVCALAVYVGKTRLIDNRRIA
ncbi:MAG: pantoate--beta-alanine ligase [Deltaproteobacteria bacterium]|nr:pantoate--beta-alanine ligase [Deltaproteobacteria bacterium]